MKSPIVHKTRKFYMNFDFGSTCLVHVCMLLHCVWFFKLVDFVFFQQCDFYFLILDNSCNNELVTGQVLARI